MSCARFLLLGATSRNESMIAARVGMKRVFNRYMCYYFNSYFFVVLQNKNLSMRQNDGVIAPWIDFHTREVCPKIVYVTKLYLRCAHFVCTLEERRVPIHSLLDRMQYTQLVNC